MSKKRGLSLEEKREKMLQIFYESQDFFLLKELEKMGPRKGVISQSVKDVVQSLVDDDLVSKDKIGTSVYFWSLPSCAGNQLRNVYRKLDSDLQNSKNRHAQLVEQCQELRKGREESEERAEAVADLKAVEQQHNELKVELEKYRDNDPAAFEAMREAIAVAQASANRWTGSTLYAFSPFSLTGVLSERGEMESLVLWNVTFHIIITMHVEVFGVYTGKENICYLRDL
ncbi:hypothetical protein VIGAN_11256600 [Vigna angularis var. angularis]|uniref:Mnd1 HTH domain-containing protein n=1 Tax=Vigna angularis var. angularis TaxID=157739 RepID=A0A0S3TCU0_PHAAN|nr:hypothetical protein VIGAN_11256600 [Vigna angularis var. angularis]